jgi:hypothetical protein
LRRKPRRIKRLSANLARNLPSGQSVAPAPTSYRRLRSNFFVQRRANLFRPKVKFDVEWAAPGKTHSNQDLERRILSFPVNRRVPVANAKIEATNGVVFDAGKSPISG